MNRIIITSIFALLAFCSIAQNNVNTVVQWHPELNAYRVYLSNGSAPQTISFSGFNLDIDAPAGTTLAIGAVNPYGLILDQTAAAGAVHTYVKPGTSVGVVFTTAAPGDLILELIPSGPNVTSEVAISNQYVELAGIDRTGSVILPIKLSKFDVRPFGDIKASDLRWSSSSEVNASHFEIERSIDGINFTNIGRINANGNSNWSIEYNFIDRSLPLVRSGVEIYYYRLRMVDLDGSAEYSETRSIRFDNGDAVIVKMGPNPTMNVLSVNMSSPNTEETEAPANVYDQSGRLVTSKKVNTNGVTEIDFSNFPNAIYNISIEHNGKTYNNRIIKSN
jgi:Secretion system C-terminal sorting domain